MGPHGFEKHSIVLSKLTSTVEGTHRRAPYRVKSGIVSIATNMSTQPAGYHRATALIRISGENNIIQSDRSDSSTKLSMFIWALRASKV